MSSLLDNRIDLSKYDFIDVGSSSGGAMDYAQRKLGWGSGVGIDLSPVKVEAAIKAGRNVVNGDARELDQVFKNKCRFAIASHFLEHLPSADVAIECLRSLSMHVTEGVFVQQPTFDHMDELAAMGLKLFWTDWSGHPNMMTIEAWRHVIDVLVNQEKVFASAILGVAKPIADSADDALIPIACPTNSHAYDQVLHGVKPVRSLERTMYREVKVIFHKELDLKLLLSWGMQFGLLNAEIS